MTKPFAVGEPRARMANLEASRFGIEDLQVTQARTLADQLQRALNSRGIIEQAKGLLAAHLGTDVREAFEVLRRYARNNKLQLHDLARDVVERGFRP